MTVKCLPWMHDYRPVDYMVVRWYETHAKDARPVKFTTEVYDRCWCCPKLRTRVLNGQWSRKAIGLPGEA